MAEASPKKKRQLSEAHKAKLRENGRKGGLANSGVMSLRVRTRKLKEGKIRTELQQRIMIAADKLFNSQMIAAHGSHQMVVMEKDDEGMMHARKITDEVEMQNLLDVGIYGKDYLILAGKNPDWKAAEALLNRGFGKAQENKTITVDHQHSFAQLAKARAKLPQVQLLKEKEPIDVSATEIQTP